MTDVGDAIGHTSGAYIAQTSLTTGNMPMGVAERARAEPILRRILATPVTKAQKLDMIARVPLLVVHLQPEYRDALLDGRARL